MWLLSVVTRAIRTALEQLPRPLVHVDTAKPTTSLSGNNVPSQDLRNVDWSEDFNLLLATIPLEDHDGDQPVRCEQQQQQQHNIRQPPANLGLPHDSILSSSRARLGQSTSLPFLAIGTDTPSYEHQQDLQRDRRVAAHWDSHPRCDGASPGPPASLKGTLGPYGTPGHDELQRLAKTSPLPSSAMLERFTNLIGKAYDERSGSFKFSRKRRRSTFPDNVSATSTDALPASHTTNSKPNDLHVEQGDFQASVEGSNLAPAGARGTAQSTLERLAPISSDAFNAETEAANEASVSGTLPAVAVPAQSSSENGAYDDRGSTMSVRPMKRRRRLTSETLPLQSPRAGEADGHAERIECAVEDSFLYGDEGDGDEDDGEEEEEVLLAKNSDTQAPKRRRLRRRSPSETVHSDIIVVARKRPVVQDEPGVEYGSSGVRQRIGLQSARTSSTALQPTRRSGRAPVPRKLAPGEFAWAGESAKWRKKRQQAFELVV